MKIAIVVASAMGHTRRLAEAFATGARDAGAEVVLLDAVDAEVKAIEDADAIVLGSGVHMAGIAAPMRAFLERLAPAWMAGRFIGRIGAAFVTSGAGARGGGELALISLWAALAEHGMQLVSMPNRTKGFSAAGCHFGPIAWTNPRAGQAGPTPEHEEAARDFGRHVAEIALRYDRAGADRG